MIYLAAYLWFCACVIPPLAWYLSFNERIRWIETLPRDQWLHEMYVYYRELEPYDPKK